MMHSNRMFPYMIGAAALAAVVIAFGAPLATVLPFTIFLACPLMMFMMMRGKNKNTDIPQESHVHGNAGSDETAKTTTQA